MCNIGPQSTTLNPKLADPGDVFCRLGPNTASVVERRRPEVAYNRPSSIEFTRPPHGHHPQTAIANKDGISEHIRTCISSRLRSQTKTASQNTFEHAAVAPNISEPSLDVSALSRGVSFRASGGFSHGRCGGFRTWRCLLAGMAGCADRATTKMSLRYSRPQLGLGRRLGHTARDSARK